jgi:radical SAM-linked protein
MAKPVPGRPPPPPTVQRLTIRYAKRGRMRFASHRDVARAMERGVRKAGIPVAYSAGFSPHPRISYSGGAPTGSASEAEYLDIAVTRRCEPEDVGRRLNAALPDGIDVIQVVEAADGTASALKLEASVWEVAWPGVAPGAAASAVRAFLAAPTAEVRRLTTKGMRVLDARAAVISLTCESDQGATGATLRMTVRQMTPAVRPDDVLTALRNLSALEPTSPPLATRLWQGPLSALTATPIADPESLPAGPGGPEYGARLPELMSAPMTPVRRPAEDRPQRMTNNATRLAAKSAEQAPASQARANDQLPRGTLGQLADPRAREPHGRDCPNARNGATEQTARTP